jgi:TetR/AcrR family transcriptional regulator, cholesterol catabolism regulator
MPLVDERPRSIEILNVAATLFAEQGVSATSMQQIADAIGIQKSALYYFFKQKEDIVNAIVVGTTDLVLERVRAAVEAETDATRKLKAFGHAFAQLITSNHHRMVAAMVGFGGMNHPKIGARDKYEEIMRQIVRQGVREGVFRTSNQALTGRAFLSCLSWMTRWWDPKGPLTAEEIVDHYWDLLLKGLVTDERAVRGRDNR